MTEYQNHNTPIQEETQVKKPKVQKPPTFKKMEIATKNILAAKGINYYDWLHEAHEKLVQETMLANVDSIGSLVKS
ncbi:hypothetical protein ACFVXR_28795 [Bacillus thuringiensis]|uniref:hypothetical protein n=1 Tax=Bacillus cereus group TaxID=86661 RepID=UPI0007B6BCEE|nr:MULTISPECIES: hypothetical protein [Bacillus cereus group]ANC22932.1 hypothetical protein WR52_29905 [Bacillus cereus]KAA0828227.1 hypothetical protein DN403_09355 [Bacillus sp. AY2-1]KAA6470319.1 hypothetical protein DX931_28090 [Bacillus cereus]MDA2067836.1 hypothetical protein [Bacillus cereus]MDA2079583.1 hypothetical protein [Bacillus cereus]